MKRSGNAGGNGNPAARNSFASPANALAVRCCPPRLYLGSAAGGGEPGKHGHAGQPGVAGLEVFCDASHGGAGTDLGRRLPVGGYQEPGGLLRLPPLPPGTGQVRVQQPAPLGGRELSGAQVAGSKPEVM